MGDTIMTDFAELCSKPFVDILRHLSDYPITCSVFISLIVGVVTQDIASGFIAFGICLVLLAAVYVLTFGRAFGRGGLKNHVEHRS